MQLVKFTHANNNETIYIIKDKICGYYYSPTHKASIVMCDGATAFPASESVAVISERIGGILTTDSKGESSNVGTN